MRREHEPPRYVLALDGRQNVWQFVCRPTRAKVRLEVIVEALAVGGETDFYNSPQALTLESFDDLRGYGPSKENRYVKYVWDSEDRYVPTKPGVSCGAWRFPPSPMSWM